MNTSIKFGYTPNDDVITHNLEQIAANLEGLASEEVYKACFGLMDQTTLSGNDTPSSVKAMVEKVNAIPRIVVNVRPSQAHKLSQNCFSSSVY